MNRKRYAKPRIGHSFQSAINSGGKKEKIEPSQCNDLYFLKWFGVLHHKAIAATRKPYHKIDDKKVSVPKAPENKDKSQIRKKTSLNAAQISRSEPPPRNNTSDNVDIVDLDTGTKKKD
ncbi:hypothetical protein ECG_01994 [Echinococcus granulosus]|nr:hypothetical protein ECG_01994 [Echinococcus granulosus]